MRCTHKGAELNQKGEELICPSHGSIFDMEGNVIKAPANKGLKSFPVTAEPTEIIVHLIK